jgi:hypothetical protein
MRTATKPGPWVRAFNIFKVADDDVRDWIAAAATLDAAKASVQEFAELWPREYIISEEGTPEPGDAKKQ